MFSTPKAFTLVFRRDAVARKGDAPPSQIAKDSGISESCPHRWLKLTDIDDGVRPDMTSGESAEQAGRQNRILEQETRSCAAPRRSSPCSRRTSRTASTALGQPQAVAPGRHHRDRAHLAPPPPAQQANPVEDEMLHTKTAQAAPSAGWRSSRRNNGRCALSTCSWAPPQTAGPCLPRAAPASGAAHVAPVTRR